MLVITVEVDAPEGQAIGIKEDLAMYLERFGSASVVAVEVVPDQQAMPGVIPEEHTEIQGSLSSGVRCCLGCGFYQRSDPGLGPDGKVVWGRCAGTGAPVRDLKHMCQRWCAGG